MFKTFFNPIPGYILIEVIETEAGSEFAVAGEEKTPIKGKVIAIPTVADFLYPGVGIVSYICPVKAGDIILHASFGHQEFRHGTKKYRLVPIDKILGVYNEK